MWVMNKVFLSVWSSCLSQDQSFVAIIELVVCKPHLFSDSSLWIHICIIVLTADFFF